jgi:hypothetical protein
MTTAEEVRVETFSPPAKLQRALLATSVAGALVFVLGAFVAPERAWANLLIAGAYILALAIGPLFFLAVQHVARSGWATAFRRVPEAMVKGLPLAAVLLGLVLVGSHHVYEWTHRDVMQADEVLRGKMGWLNLPFFGGRAVVSFGIWILFSRALLARSLRQDQDRTVAHTDAAVKLSAIFLVLFALTYSVASWDWLMSVDPHWFSTIFAVYNFAGTFTTGLAGIIIFVIALRRLGPLRGVVRDEHLHDLGKLLFGFCTFWAYIWVSQYMLTWYSNLGEETGFWVVRLSGGWKTLVYVNVALNWLIPFVVLLPRPAKRNEKVLLAMAGVVLLGHWLDLYLVVLPGPMGAQPTVHLWEVGPMVGAVALFAWSTLRALGRVPIVPVGDPTLGESLGYHD